MSKSLLEVVLHLEVRKPTIKMVNLLYRIVFYVSVYCTTKCILQFHVYTFIANKQALIFEMFTSSEIWL